MKELDIRDISIIDALPVYKGPKKVFTVGCGIGRIEFHLHKMGYNVVATDVKRMVKWSDIENLIFRKFNILKPDNSVWPIVICSEVLEHIQNYKQAFRNLISLAGIRVIITVPYGNSFNSPDHVNFWHNSEEFYELGKPYVVSVSRIRTKPKDAKKNQWCYLIIIDKRQCYE